MMAVRSGRKRGRTLHRLLARVEICLFILVFPGWAFPYMLVVGMAGWEPVDAGWIVPGVWPLLWVVLTTRRIVAHARSISSRFSRDVDTGNDARAVKVRGMAETHPRAAP